MATFQTFIPYVPTTPGTGAVQGAPSSIYDVNPAPRGGQGPYGLVPGATGLPDPHGDLAKLIPGLDSATGQASQNIIHELTGELPPDVIAQIQNEGARFGVSSGMPGSTLSSNRSARNLGLTSLGLQRNGLQDYEGLTGSVKTNQTVPPSLQAEISANNANLNAAPDPAARAQALEDAFNRGRGGVAGLGGGFGGSLGAPNLHAAPGNPAGMGAPNAFPVASGDFHGTGGGGGGGGGGGAAPWTPGPAIYPGSTGAPLDFTGGSGSYDFGGNAGGSNWQDILDSYGLGGAPDPYTGGDPFAWMDESGAGGVPFGGGGSPLDDPFAWMDETGSSGVPYDNSADTGTGE
jgi:hypothetical protein